MRRALLIIVGSLAAAAAPAATTPPPGSAERAAILEALRAGTGTRSRFYVDHLRVGRGHAFIVFRGVNALGTSGHGFVSRRLGAWRLDWAVAGGGATDCAELARLYDDALRRAGRERLFSRDFLAEAADTREQARRGEICIGDIIAAPR